MSNYIERYWRDATPEDAIAEPPMVARFRDEDDKEWLIGKLFGFDRSRKYKWCGETRDAIKCQVYDAPDPGEGWRLIDVEKETPQDGDEFFATSSKAWCFCNEQTLRAGYARHAIVRRRIEQPKPKYVPFTWEDREQLRGRWVSRKEYSGVTIETLIEKLESDERGLFLINGYTAKQMLDLWRFLDTGEPVGRKVQ